MTLAYTLNENNIELDELNFDTSIAFASMSGAFIGGTGDYVALFEPTALQLEKQGFGYVVASLGELGGEVPYTTYMTKKSYLNDKESESLNNQRDKLLKLFKSEFQKHNIKEIKQYREILDK